MSFERIDRNAFYGEYHGHLPSHLTAAETVLRAAGKNLFVLAGDSSLDNKFWLPKQAHTKPVNGYENFLTSGKAVPDVAHAVNALCASSALPWACINASIEESTLGDRAGGKLRAQDEWIRDHITEEDILVLSVGGNDIALRPSASTVACMAALLLCSDKSLEDGTAWGYSHFIKMWRDDTAAFIKALCAKRTPKAVVVCMIYYPHESAALDSWANFPLGKLGYDKNPRRLQTVIRTLYRLATCQLQPLLPETTVIPCPLFEVLDPSPSSVDYVQRVEPSVAGGRKMAAAFLRLTAPLRSPLTAIPALSGSTSSNSRSSHSSGSSGSAGRSSAAGGLAQSAVQLGISSGGGGGAASDPELRVGGDALSLSAGGGGGGGGGIAAATGESETRSQGSTHGAGGSVAVSELTSRPSSASAAAPDAASPAAAGGEYARAGNSARARRGSTPTATAAAALPAESATGTSLPVGPAAHAGKRAETLAGPSETGAGGIQTLAVTSPASAAAGATRTGTGTRSVQVAGEKMSRTGPQPRGWWCTSCSVM